MVAKYLHVLYAEDIRHEASGQLSLIGVYQGGLRIPHPLTIPKLCIKADLFIPKDEFISSLSVQIAFNEEIIQNIEVPADYVAGARSSTKIDEDSHSYGYGCQMLFTLSPFEVHGEGRLRISAIIDGIKLTGNSLKVQIGPLPAN